MATLAEELTALKTEEDKIIGNKVANFAYDDYAYEHNDANGVDTYNVDSHQNIPNGTASILKVNSTILTKGWRAQASAITRMLMNHFLGRCSYNLNKVNDYFSTLLAKLISYLGTANGIATLDADGKVPDTQLKLGGANGIATLGSDGRVRDYQLPLAEANGIATLGSDGKVSDSQLTLYKHVIRITTSSSGNYPNYVILARIEHIDSSPEAITKTSIVSSFDGIGFPAYWEERRYNSASEYTTEARGATVLVQLGQLSFEGYREMTNEEQRITLSEGFRIGHVDIGDTRYDVISYTTNGAIDIGAPPAVPYTTLPFNYSYELTDTVTPLSDSF